MSGYRYGPYTGGPDPLEPPYDVRGAVDALGESVLDGTDPGSALRDLLRRGMSATAGWTTCCARYGNGSARSAVAAGSTGSWTRRASLLDTAIGQERAELFPNPDDSARMREDELDRCPLTPRRRSGSWPTTTGSRRPPGRPSRS